MLSSFATAVERYLHRAAAALMPADQAEPEYDGR